MKPLFKFLFIITLVTAASVLWSWRVFKEPRPISFPRFVNRPVTMCGTVSFDWTDTTATQARILPGLGNLHYPVTTTSLKAQEFFEQGLRLVYAFNHWEAIQAFREAIRLDPEFAMGYWGLSLAYGPNLNDVNPKDRERIAFESIQKAKEKNARISQVEKDMIEAMAARYDGKAYDNRDSLNQAYATAMIDLAKRYPNDAEAQTLCADAIMNTMPWDYWNSDGTPKPATAQAKQLLETTIKLFPNHPGAHHLYIHLVEASSSPDQALASAKLLETAMPGAGHIVHMPAHIYLRTGQYTRAIELNQQAAKVDEEYLSGSDNRGMYRFSYYPHNVDFISFGSYMEGRSNLAIQAAMKLAYKGAGITDTNPAWAQYLLNEPLIAFTRFGKWNDILSLPEPDQNLIHANLMWRFARGMALTRTGKLVQAEFELHKLDSIARLDTLKNSYFSFNPISEVAKVPMNLLRGELRMAQKKTDEGLAALNDALAAERNLRYNEPPDWKLPVRHYLGAALLDLGKYAEAEAVYLDDLKVNPDNGWSLIGLQQCQAKQGKKSEVVSTAKRYTKAWKNADVSLTSSRY